MRQTFFFIMYYKQTNVLYLCIIVYVCNGPTGSVAYYVLIFSTKH